MRTCSAQTPADRLRRQPPASRWSRPGSVVLRSGCARVQALDARRAPRRHVAHLAAGPHRASEPVRRAAPQHVQGAGAGFRLHDADGRLARAESGQRYEMIINLADQTYLLRELTGSDLTALPFRRSRSSRRARSGATAGSPMSSSTTAPYTNEDKSEVPGRPCRLAVRRQSRVSRRERAAVCRDRQSGDSHHSVDRRRPAPDEAQGQRGSPIPVTDYGR